MVMIRGKEWKKNTLRKITEITEELNNLIKENSLSENEKKWIGNRNG